MSLAAWAWDGLVPDARTWIASSEDPAARWALLTGVLDHPGDDAEVVAARQAMLAEPATQDRRALAELAACLIAYNLDDEGRVVPRSASRGFEGHSFGQKAQPSAWATARVLTVLHRVEDLVGEVRAVDVATLGSSKGGSGVAVPPRTVPPRTGPTGPGRR